MVAATRSLPSTAAGSSLPHSATDWQDKAHLIVAALWRYSAIPLTTVGGTANAITASIDTTVVDAPAALARGIKFSLIPSSTNTGGVTINVHSLGATDLLSADGSALAAGDLVSGRIYLIEYDASSKFRVVSAAAMGSDIIPARAPDYYIRDEKANGTAGGTATAGSMQTRTLNTVARNALAGTSLASNEFTLQAGSYWIRWVAPVYEVNGHVSRLYNVTDAAVVDVAQSNVGGAAVDGMGFSEGKCFVTITAAKAFRIEHRVETTKSTDGWGQSVGLHGPEIFTTVEIYKHGSLAAAVTSVPGGAITLKMTFSTTTTMADPSSGYLRLNAATQNTATQMAIDDLDFSAVDISAIIATLDDSSSTIRGHLRISKYDDDSKWLIFALTAVIDDSGFSLVNLTPVASSSASPFAEGNIVNVKFTRTGDAGQPGFRFTFDSDISGDPGSGRFLFNHATLASASAFHVAETDGDGNVVSGFLAAIDNSTSSNKCLVIVTKAGGYIAFWITAALSDQGTYDTYAITPISSTGTFSNNDLCNIAFYPVADKGDTGAAGSNGTNGADGKDPGILLTWDTSTVDADPGGPGGIRANNASLASATLLYIDKTGRGGSDIAAFLAALDDSTNTAKGTLILTKVSDDTQATFTVGAVTDAAGYIKLAVTYLAGATSFANGAAISFQFSRAGDAGAGALAHGQCRLTKVSTNLVLSPLKGVGIVINNAQQTIPDAGVSLAPSGETPGTLYYIYAYMNAGTMTLESSTTGYSIQAGTGVAIKTGDATRTLVGMARPGAGPAWVDSATQRFVRSYFNRAPIAGTNWFTANRTTTSTSYVEINSEIRVEFLVWADDLVLVTLDVVAFTGATALNEVRSAINYDGGTSEDGVGYVQAWNTAQATVPASITRSKTALSEGYHYATLFGRSDNGGSTATWVGSGTANLRTVLDLSIHR